MGVPQDLTATIWDHLYLEFQFSQGAWLYDFTSLKVLCNWIQDLDISRYYFSSKAFIQLQHF